VPQPLYEGDEIVICSAKLKFVSEGQDPLAKKETDSDIPAIGGKFALCARSGLSMVFTSETRVPTVSATMDAARGVVETSGEGFIGEEGLKSAVARLTAMVAVSNFLSALTKPDALLDKIMESIFDVFPKADRAFIMLRDKTGKELTPKLGRSRDGKVREGENFPMSRTIISAVIEKKRSILSSDAQTDERFSTTQSIVNLSIRSLMCAPFICKDELLGVISVDTVSGARTFDSQDLAMLTSIACQAAIALKNADLFSAIEKETHVRAQLSRYLSKDVVEGVIDGTIPLRLGAEKKYGTVIFCDIVGFTGIAERLSAIEVVDMLNRYFGITTEIITRHKGTLHKFGGDMIMAFWNVMLPDSHAQLNALRAGVAMQVAIWKFDCRSKNPGQTPLYLGIGCNTGEFAGGNVGGEDRMEYTIIGDNVNLAQRIESLASRWQVFAAQATFEPASMQCCAVKLPPVQVKGKSAGIQVYSVRGIQSDPGKMSLTIPVSLLSDTHQSGMLVQFNNSDSSLHLCMAEGEKAPKSGRIAIEFDLPEVSKKMMVKGLIRSITPLPPDNGSMVIILDHLEGNEALSFLKPGCCIESDKAWEEMQRH
jgi:adenylate cyclase